MAVLRKYNNKEYDFDAYTKQVMEGFDGWIDPYEVSSTKKEKVRQAVMDLLQHMADDEGSYADLNRINFSTDYANNKGIFKKKVKDSKHYRNATAYLLKVYSGMNPYEEPKPETPTKTKASREWLGKTVLGHLGDASGYTTDAIRSAELKRALQATQNQLKTGDYDYEDQYGNEVLNTWLTDAIDALGTTNDLDDDNTFWGRVGLTNPFLKTPATKTEKYDDPLKTQYIQTHKGTSEEYDQHIAPILNALQVLQQANPKAAEYLKSLVGLEQPTTTKPYYTGEDVVSGTQLSVKNYNSYTPEQQKQLDATLQEVLSKENSTYFEDLHARAFDVSGKKYIVIGSAPLINRGGKNYLYAYDTARQVMVLIPERQITKSQKGGKLLTLRKNIYG